MIVIYLSIFLSFVILFIFSYMLYYILIYKQNKKEITSSSLSSQIELVHETNIKKPKTNYVYNVNPQCEEDYAIKINRGKIINNVDNITETISEELFNRYENDIEKDYTKRLTNNVYDSLKSNLKEIEEISIYGLEIIGNICKRRNDSISCFRRALIEKYLHFDIVKYLFIKLSIKNKHKNGYHLNIFRTYINNKHSLEDSNIKRTIKSIYEIIFYSMFTMNEKEESIKFSGYFQSSKDIGYRNRKNTNIIESIFYRVNKKYADKVKEEFNKTNTKIDSKRMSIKNEQEFARYWYTKNLELIITSRNKENEIISGVHFGASKIVKKIYDYIYLITNDEYKSYYEISKQLLESPISYRGKVTQEYREDYSDLEFLQDYRSMHKNCYRDRYSKHEYNCPDLIPASCRTIFYKIIGEKISNENNQIDFEKLKSILKKIIESSETENDFKEIIKSLTNNEMFYISYILTSLVNYLHVYVSLHQIDNRLENRIYFEK